MGKTGEFVILIRVSKPMAIASVIGSLLPFGGSQLGPASSFARSLSPGTQPFSHSLSLTLCVSSWRQEAGARIG